MWRTRVIPLSEIHDDDVPRWRELAERAIEPNVYLDPRFLRPAGQRPDAQDIRVVFAEYGDELRGVLQFTVGRLEDRWPVKVAGTGGTFMRVHADRHHPLLAPEDPAGAVQALLHGIQRVSGAGLVLLRYVPADGPVAEAVDQTLDSSGYSSLERVRLYCAYALPRSAESAEGILDTTHLSTKARKEFRRRVRSIENAAAAPLQVVDRAGDPAVLEDFLTFQASGWKGDPEQGGGAFLLDAVHERWYREVVGRFHEDGALLAPTVLAGEETVFMALGFRSGGAAFGFIDSYNDAYVRSSPGAIGRLAEWAYITRHAGVTHFDPAFDPAYAASTKLYPDRREHVDLLIGATGRGRAIIRALPYARRLRERLSRG